MSQNRIIFSLLFILVFQLFAAGNPRTLILSHTAEKHNLTPYISYIRSQDLRDTSTRIVYDTNFQKKFVQNQQKEINFGITQDIFWFRFDVQNMTSDNNWYLTVDFPPLSNITLFIKHLDGTVEEIPNTRTESIYNTIIHDNTSFVFRLDLAKNEPGTVFLRVNTSSFLLLPACLMNTDLYLKNNIDRFTILFLIFGILLASLVINIILFISTRERTYMLLVLIVTGVFFVSWYQFGFGIDFFPELNIYFKTRMRLVVSVCTVLLFNLFTVRFLELKFFKTIRSFYKILNAFLLIYLAFILLPIVPNRWMNFINPGILTFVIILNLYVGIHSAIRKIRTAAYYLPGLLLVIISSLITILFLYNFLNYHPYYSYIIILSASLFCLSVTFGLREKIATLQQEQKLSTNLKKLNEQLLAEISANEQKEKELLQCNYDLLAEQKNTSMFMSAIESTESTIVITNEKAEIEYVNPSFTRITGYAPEDVFGKNPNILKTDHHPKEYYEKLWETILAGKTWKGEFLNKKKNGELYWESAVITPLLNELTGEVFRFVAVKEDISELKNTLLELEKSEKKEKEANASKTKLFSIIGHDLLNPFNALLGFSQILADNLSDSNDTVNREYAGIISSSANKIMMLLQNLLVWAGQQTGRISFNPQKANPKDVITEAIAYILPTAEEKNIRVSYTVPENLHLEFDYQMTATILRNLLWNAVNYTDSGGSINVYVATDSLKASFSVTDTGRGIDRDHLEKLFITDPYYHKNENNGNSGYGLGLILCRDLAEAHHGEISASSTPGKGSTFTFTFPINPPENPA